jgi:hypothetical protein
LDKIKPKKAQSNYAIYQSTGEGDAIKKNTNPPEQNFADGQRRRPLGPETIFDDNLFYIPPMCFSFLRTIYFLQMLSGKFLCFTQVAEQSRKCNPVEYQSTYKKIKYSLTHSLLSSIVQP